jgi:hypothetical protein
MLGLEKEKERFEMIINNDFVRGSLWDHLLKHNINIEKVVIINYTLGLSQPREKNKNAHSDWIISL